MNIVSLWVSNKERKEAFLAMTHTPGPFQVIQQEGSSDLPADPPRRRFSCSHYDSCLNIAAALNWDNFTCRGCTGEIDDTLIWRARNALRKDSVVRSLCECPEISSYDNEPAETDPPHTFRPAAVKS